MPRRIFHLHEVQTILGQNKVGHPNRFHHTMRRISGQIDRSIFQLSALSTFATSRARIGRTSVRVFLASQARAG
jgi:hypothetical protein